MIKRSSDGNLRPSGGKCRVSGLIVVSVIWRPSGRVNGWLAAAPMDSCSWMLPASSGCRRKTISLTLRANTLLPTIVWPSARMAAPLPPATSGALFSSIRAVRKVFRELRDPDLRQAHEDNLAHLDFSPDGSLLVSGSHDRKIKVWEVASGRLLAAITALGVGNIYPVFSPDGRFLATTGNRQTVLYEISGNREQTLVAQHPYSVRAIAYSPDGKTLACLAEETALQGESRAEVTLWDVASGRVKVREDISGYARDSRSPSSLAFHPGGASLAYSFQDTAKKTFHLRDLKTGENRAPAEEWKAVSLSFARDGKTLWSAGNKGNQVASWRVPELSLASVWSNAISTIGDGRTSIYCVSAGTQWVIAGSWDGSAKLFRERDGRLVTEWPCPGGPVFCVALNGDESWFAAGARKWLGLRRSAPRWGARRGAEGTSR